MVGSNSCHQGWKQMPHASPPKIYPPGPEPPSLWDPQSAPDLVGQTRMAGSVWTLLTQRLSSVFLGLQLWREGLLQPCHCSVLPHIVGTGEAVHSWGRGACVYLWLIYVNVWFQNRKGAHQGCILLPCLFNLYVEYIKRNTGLNEAQVGIKIAGRNINNLRYTVDTTLMAESKELKSLLMKVKEKSEKVCLKLNIQKN